GAELEERPEALRVRRQGLAQRALGLGEVARAAVEIGDAREHLGVARGLRAQLRDDRERAVLVALLAQQRRLERHQVEVVREARAGRARRRERLVLLTRERERLGVQREQVGVGKRAARDRQTELARRVLVAAELLVREAQVHVEDPLVREVLGGGGARQDRLEQGGGAHVVATLLRDRDLQVVRLQVVAIGGEQPVG